METRRGSPRSNQVNWSVKIRYTEITEESQRQEVTEAGQVWPALDQVMSASQCH